MIPYVIVPPIHLGFVTVQPFGLLVAIGVLVGWTLVSKRARVLGFDEEHVQTFLWWMILGGFIGAHLFEVLFYHPLEVLKTPMILVQFWKGISSFGGFGGATLGGLAWKYYELRDVKMPGIFATVRVPTRRAKPMPLLPYADVMLAAFPVAWVFGRTGCAISHDHPGALANPDSFLAVAYGPGNVVDYGFFLLKYGTAPRYDLGLLELAFTVVVALTFALSWSRGGARGYYVVALSLLYSPVRFLLDFLRAPAADGGDERYAALTPAQWACLVVFVYGWLLLRHIRHSPPPPKGYVPQ